MQHSTPPAAAAAAAAAGLAASGAGAAAALPGVHAPPSPRKAQAAPVAALVPNAAEVRRVFWDMARHQPTHGQLLAGGACSVAAQHPQLNRYSDCWPLDAHLAPTGGVGYLNATLVPRLWGAAPAYVPPAAGGG